MRSLDKYVSGNAELGSEVVTDLGRAIHGIGDHVVDLHQRIAKLEEDKPEWTTRGMGSPTWGLREHHVGSTNRDSGTCTRAS